MEFSTKGFSRAHQPTVDPRTRRKLEEQGILVRQPAPVLDRSALKTLDVKPADHDRLAKIVAWYGSVEQAVHAMIWNEALHIARERRGRNFPPGDDD